MSNAYGGESTPWTLPKVEPQPVTVEKVYELTDTSHKPVLKDIVHSALKHLELHPDAALLAYRLLSQRFAISG